jgi:GGDEF domain-containing protein
VEEIFGHLKEQDARIAELKNLATTDALTKILNRRDFD